MASFKLGDRVVFIGKGKKHGWHGTIVALKWDSDDYVKPHSDEAVVDFGVEDDNRDYVKLSSLEHEKEGK